MFKERIVLNSLIISTGISHKKLYSGYLTCMESKADWHSWVLTLYSLVDKS